MTIGCIPRTSLELTLAGRRRMMRLIWIVTLCGLAGCTDCSLNGGWERMVNPLCVDSARVGADPVAADRRQPCSVTGTQDHASIGRVAG